MKIFYITQVAIPSTSAESVGTMCLCEAFAALGYNTTLITRNTFWKLPPEGYTGDVWDFYGVNRNFKVKKTVGLPQIPSLPRLKTVFERFALYYVDKSDSVIYTRSVSMCKRAIASHSHVILELHEAISIREQESIKKFSKSPWLLGVVVITEALRRYYTERIPTLAEKILVAPDGVRYSSYAEAASHKGHRDCDNGSSLVAGYVGSFYPGKGIEVIVELAKLCPDVSFKVYGGSNNKIRSGLGTRDLPENLMIGGFVPQSRVPQCMATFDIGLLPNQEKVLIYGGKDIGRWTSPIKMFEYMASACAIIASDISVLREVLRHEDNALLVPPTDYHAWQKAIYLLKEKPKLRKRLQMQAQKEARERYSWQIRAEHICSKLIPRKKDFTKNQN